MSGSLLRCVRCAPGARPPISPRRGCSDPSPSLVGYSLTLHWTSSQVSRRPRATTPSWPWSTVSPRWFTLLPSLNSRPRLRRRTFSSPRWSGFTVFPRTLSRTVGPSSRLGCGRPFVAGLGPWSVCRWGTTPRPTGRRSRLTWRWRLLCDTWPPVTLPPGANTSPGSSTPLTLWWAQPRACPLSSVASVTRLPFLWYGSLPGIFLYLPSPASWPLDTWGLTWSRRWLTPLPSVSCSPPPSRYTQCFTCRRLNP